MEVALRMIYQDLAWSYECDTDGKTCLLSVTDHSKHLKSGVQRELAKVTQQSIQHCVNGIRIQPWNVCLYLIPNVTFYYRMGML